MKPAWDKLMEHNDDNKIIAKVDCTVEKDLCAKHEVQGFPTIKFGDPNNMQKYSGGREYDDLKKFLDELKTPCTAQNTNACSEEQIQLLEKFMNMGPDELQKNIQEAEELIENERKNFDAKVKVLQEEFKTLKENTENNVRNIENKGLDLMKSIHTDKQQEL